MWAQKKKNDNRGEKSEGQHCIFTHCAEPKGKTGGEKELVLDGIGKRFVLGESEDADGAENGERREQID